MLNPSLSNFVVDFSDEFFPKALVSKYEDYLKHVNHPFKTWKANLLESFVELTIPGFNINPLQINAMDNTGLNPRNPRNPTGFPHVTNNYFWEGNESWSNTIESLELTLGFRNNILNYMYLFELMYNRYLRTRDVELFTIIINLLDSAEIPAMKVICSDCFIKSIPSMMFSFTETFNERKQFDIQLQSNKIDIEFNIPDFKKKDLILNQSEKS